MTTRIGVYVGADWLAGIALGRRGIAWHATVARAGDTPLESQLASLLLGIPLERFTRSHVFVALGPTLAQVKQLRGLPPIGAPRVLRQLIEAAPSRFFLMEDAVPVVADPMRFPEGWWVAVANAKTLAAVDAACTRRGLRSRGVRPVGILLDSALASAPAGIRITWCDGGIRLDVTCGDRGIASLRRESMGSSEPAALSPRLDDALQGIGADAWRFAGAYAAARAGSAAPLLLRRTSDGHRRPHQVARRIVSIAAVIIGATVMLGAPGVAAARARSQNEQAYDALRAAASSATKERRTVERQQAALSQLRAFATTRRLLTPMLSSLSMQLPESTAIVALRLDTLGGTLVTLSPDGADLVAAVSGTPGVDGLQLSAPITREMVGSLELQRMALQFRFKRQASMSRAQRR